LSEIYLSYDAVAYVLLAITVKHREYTLLACISHVWATEGLTDEGKKKGKSNSFRYLAKVHDFAGNDFWSPA